MNGNRRCATAVVGWRASTPTVSPWGVGKFMLLAAAEAVVDEVNVLLASSRPRVLYRRQLEESAGSITSNIREGLGRREGPERNQFYRHARGSAEETDDRL